MKGMGSLYLRGATWWMTFNHNGRQFRISCSTDNKSVAKGKLKQEIQKTLATNFVAPDKRKVTVSDLVTDLLSHFKRIGKTTFRADCLSRWEGRLKATFENMRAADLGTASMNAYRDTWAATGKSHTTINRDLQVLRRAYRLAADSEPPKVERVPKFALMKEDNARKIFISEEQVDKLRLAASRQGLWDRVLVDLLYAYGWRRGELLGLKVSDVDLAEGIIRLQTSKNDDPREVPMTEAIKTLITPLVIDGSPNDLVFPPVDMRCWWRRLCKVAGLKAGKKDGGIVIHDFRRTAARAKRTAGVSESVVMEISGWRSPSMFKRYAICDNTDKLDALRRQEESRTIQ